MSETINVRFERLERPVFNDCPMRIVVRTPMTRRTGSALTAHLGRQEVQGILMDPRGQGFTGYVPRLPEPGDQLVLRQGMHVVETNVRFQPPAQAHGLDYDLSPARAQLVANPNPAPRLTPEQAAEAPLAFANWEREVRPVAATPLTSPRQVALATIQRAPGMEYRLETAGPNIVVTGMTTRIGERVTGPRPELVALGPRTSSSGSVPRSIEGQRPAHLALRSIPAPLPRELERLDVRYRRAERREPSHVAGLGYAQPYHVFAPDTRRVFSDTSYPWCCCGHIPEVGASGTMVGPRHVLTAAHALNIVGGNLAPMSFVPLAFDAQTPPFGSANVVRAFYFTRTTTRSITDQQVAFDYAVCVLDRRLGDLTGWMGTKVYNTSWNGGSYWAHVGYPVDINSGNRPVFHGPGIIDSTGNESFGGRSSLRLLHQNDIEPGDSGGPFFGMFSGKPYVVGVQSGEDGSSTPPYSPNLAAGGEPLVELVRHALTTNP